MERDNKFIIGITAGFVAVSLVLFLSSGELDLGLGEGSGDEDVETQRIDNPSFEQYKVEQVAGSECLRPEGWRVVDADTDILCITSANSTDGNYSLYPNWRTNGLNQEAYVEQEINLSEVDNLSVDIVGNPEGKWNTASRSFHNIYINEELVKECGYVSANELKTCEADISDYQGLNNVRLTWEQNYRCESRSQICDNLGSSRKDNIQIW